MLALIGCSTGGTPTIQQDENHWVVLDVNDSSNEDGESIWSFELRKSGLYDVQIIGAPSSTDTNVSALTVSIDGVEIAGALEQNFSIVDEGQQAHVLQFQAPYKFRQSGAHTLSLNVDENVTKVRLVPNFKNPLGTGEFDEKWLSMHESPEKKAALEWFKEARFGMFIHWGLYSGAAGSWNGTRIKESPIPGPNVAEWLMFRFQISREEYAELAKGFNPDKSFAQNFARLAKDTGMKYVVITSKHHDGFALFDSKVSDYNMVDATPYKADAIKELYDAVRAEGLEFGVYYSHGNDWADGTDGNFAAVKQKNDALGIYTHPLGKNLWDPSNNSHSDYLESKAYPQIEELITLLPDLRVIWFDGDGLITEEQAFRFYKLVYDLNPNILVNRRVGYRFGDYLDAGDNIIPSGKETLSKHWETCGTTNNSWGYNAHDDNWKSTSELLYYFIDIASKGGNYLLNIGPDGEGKVPEPSANRLREMGKWIKTNSDAIYGTTSWDVQSEGQEEATLKGTAHREEKGFTRSFTQQDFWFTARENKVYAMSLAQPKGNVAIKSLSDGAGDVQSVRLLGSSEALRWEQSPGALVIDFSGVQTGEHGYAVEVVLNP